MPDLVLVRGKGTHAYPQPVKDLTEFIMRHTEYWPVVADYLREVLTTYEDDRRKQKFSALMTEYFSRGGNLGAEARHLWSLLQDLYALPSGKTEPRGLFLEFLVHRAGPFSPTLRACAQLQREVQCALHERNGDRTTKCVPESESTLDVAFLGAGHLEGHECKIRIRNFVSVGKPVCAWDSDVRNKLAFMQATHGHAIARGVDSHICFTGLDEEWEQLRTCLQQNGFGEIGILGREALDKLFENRAPA